MNRRFLGRMAAVFGAALWLGLSLPAQAADEAPDAMMTRLSKQVLEARASWLMALRSALARTAVRS